MARPRVRVNHRSRRLRKEAKTKPVFGSHERGGGDDKGKYYKCWNCGFICDKDRDALGGADSRDGVEPEAYTQLQDDVSTTAYHCQGAAGADQATCEAAGGTWSSTRYKPNVSSGCPFCGSLNWKT